MKLYVNAEITDGVCLSKYCAKISECVLKGQNQ